MNSVKFKINFIYDEIKLKMYAFLLIFCKTFNKIAFNLNKNRNYKLFIKKKIG